MTHDRDTDDRRRATTGNRVSTSRATRRCDGLDVRRRVRTVRALCATALLRAARRAARRAGRGARHPRPAGSLRRRRAACVRRDQGDHASARRRATPLRPTAGRTHSREGAGDAVLRGYTAFARGRCAARGCARSCAKGPCASSACRASAARAARRQDRRRKLDAALAAIDPREFDGTGVASRRHLADGVTFSVGCVECGGEAIAYCGTQRTTRNARGHDVYGGSDARRRARRIRTRCSRASCRSTRGQRSSSRGPTTTPPSPPTRARSHPGATTTCCSAATPPAARAPACSSNRGASAARAAPRWSPWRRSSGDAGRAQVRVRDRRDLRRRVPGARRRIRLLPRRRRARRAAHQIRESSSMDDA